MRKVWGVQTVFLALAFTAGAAFSAEPEPAGKWQDFDQDGDRKVDKTYFYTSGRLARLEKDRNHDGRTDTWVEYDEEGHVTVVGTDEKGKDAKPDFWRFYKDGSGVSYQKEWDRNFDGKPDLRIILRGKQLIETQFDDDYDGVFETTKLPPQRGESGINQTTPAPQ